MIRIPPTQIENAQQLIVEVPGPDGANRLFVLDGQLNCNMGSQANAQSKETFSVLLGPVITRRQFVQAVSAASLTGFSAFGSNPAWIIGSVDADWDDESGQVELRIEVTVWNGAALSKLGYHVTILAQI